MRGELTLGLLPSFATLEWKSKRIWNKIGRRK